MLEGIRVRAMPSRGRNQKFILTERESRLLFVLEQPQTSAPELASSIARTLPIPEPTPVTRYFLPENSLAMLL